VTEHNIMPLLNHLCVPAGILASVQTYRYTISWHILNNSDTARNQHFLVHAKHQKLFPTQPMRRFFTGIDRLTNVQTAGCAQLFCISPKTRRVVVAVVADITIDQCNHAADVALAAQSKIPQSWILLAQCRGQLLYLQNQL
jgi:hypothetical protein